MRILNAVRVRNYRSIIDQSISFEDMTSFVGANESGKSNILSAINHLESANQYRQFDLNELNLSAQHQADEVIRIDYEIILSESIAPLTLKALPMMVGKKVILSKFGEPRRPIDWEINIDQLPGFGNVIVRKGKISQFKTVFKENGVGEEVVDTFVSQKWFLSGGDINLVKKPFCDFEANGLIEVLRENQKKEFVKARVLEELLRNIQIYFWTYDRNHYLKESISLSDFCINPNNFHSVLGIFKIAKEAGAFTFNITPQSLDKYLQKSTSTARTNLLSEISKKFNTIFNKSWRTLWGNKVKLIMGYEGVNLSFRFDDGRQCPPEYRSDGFKWFITFLINFQSKEQTLSNYILLMDEPGGTLHPKGQKDALEFLNNLNKNNQIIYSTHQTFLLNKNRPNNIRILDRSRRDKARDFFPTIVNSIKDERRHILTDSLLREALGFSLTDISPINESNVLVEGAFDRNILHICNDVYSVLNLNVVSIIDCGKASNIKYSAMQYKESNLKVICIYDKDEAGKSAYESNPIEKKYKYYISNTDGCTIEDALPEFIFREAYDSLCSKHPDVLEIKTVSKPFISNTLAKSYRGDLPREKRWQLKHEIEDIMIKNIRTKINSHRDEFLPMIELLKQIKAALE